jgi:UDP-galactopyranose mutase
LEAAIVGYTGAIFPRDAQLMAKAFDQLHSMNPDTRLLLIGYCNVPVQELVREPSAVLRTGPLSFDQLVDHLAACDIGWLPLTNSGANRGRSPLKLNDFMAAGRPVVSTSVGDLGGFFQQYEVGLLAKDDPKVLADVILGLLEDPERIRAMGERARRLAENEFSWGRVADRLEAFYESCIEARPHRRSRG